MEVREHVLCAIDDAGSDKIQSALMHACFALDGSAQKFYNKNQIGRADYKKFVRKYYWLFSLFFGNGIDFQNTKWENVSIDNGNGKIINDPDLADIIYHIFRCSHAHGKSVPANFDISEKGVIYFSKDKLHLPQNLLWGILAISVFCNSNKDISSDTNHFITWSSGNFLDVDHYFIIKYWWGREQNIRYTLSPYPKIRVALKGLGKL